MNSTGVTTMKVRLLAATAAIALSGSVTIGAASADSVQQTTHAERMQRWAADRETVLDAKLTGMKAGLQLTANQEKLWTPFEAAVKDADKSRADAMQKMMQARDDNDRMSPVDRLEAVADRLSQGAADIRKIADAAKPLYDSLNDDQKHRFGMLGRMLMPERPQFAEEMRRHPPIGGTGRDGAE
jgi:hypothetical protein